MRETPLQNEARCEADTPPREGEQELIALPPEGGAGANQGALPRKRVRELTRRHKGARTRANVGLGARRFDRALAGANLVCRRERNMAEGGWPP